MNKKWILIGFCGLMVLSALFSAVTRHLDRPPEQTDREIPERSITPRKLPITGSNPARQFGTAIADAVEKVMPSVVVVRTKQVQYRKVQEDLFGFFYRVVREDLMGEGSGVIIDQRGYVITSWHVVEDDQNPEVVLNDGTKLSAKVIGFDKATDLAVLKIEGKLGKCPVVEYGDSDAIRVGEVVIAIGSPFSLASSVTVGHVSQKGRRVKILPYEDFIQTDAAINQGNSGGPLIDVDGRLIGINAAIQTEAEQKGVGIAFAIPSSLAMVIAQSLIEKGVHEWPWVGASFGRVAISNDSSTTKLCVLQVWRNTPAALSRIQPGDVVLEVDGRRVTDQYDIYRIIFSHSVGERVTIMLQRGTQDPFKVELQLEEFPGSTP